MKRFEKVQETKKNIEGIMSMLNPDEILNTVAMRSVKGGEGNNNEIVLPPPPSTNNG